MTLSVGDPANRPHGFPGVCRSFLTPFGLAWFLLASSVSPASAQEDNIEFVHPSTCEYADDTGDDVESADTDTSFPAQEITGLWTAHDYSCTLVDGSEFSFAETVMVSVYDYVVRARKTTDICVPSGRLHWVVFLDSDRIEIGRRYPGRAQQDRSESQRGWFDATVEFASSSEAQLTTSYGRTAALVRVGSAQGASEPDQIRSESTPENAESATSGGFDAGVPTRARDASTLPPGGLAPDAFGPPIVEEVPPGPQDREAMRTARDEAERAFQSQGFVSWLNSQPAFRTPRAVEPSDQSSNEIRFNEERNQWESYRQVTIPNNPYAIREFQRKYESLSGEVVAITAFGELGMILAVGAGHAVDVSFQRGYNSFRRALSARSASSSEIGHSFTNLGSNPALHNETVLSLYSPGRRRQVAFSGIYDPETGLWLMRPSGSTRLSSGAVPSNLVPARGGHAQVLTSMREMYGIQASRAVGFTAFYEGEGQLVLEFLSRSVNGVCQGRRYPPVQYYPLIRDTIEMSTGFRTLSR